MQQTPSNHNNKHLYNSIKSIIELSRENAIRSVNTAMVHAYFEIGYRIVENEQAGEKRAGYAKETLKTLSKALTKEFGRGYSVDNLELMRSFYMEYQKSYTVSRISAKKILRQFPRQRLGFPKHHSSSAGHITCNC